MGRDWLAEVFLACVVFGPACFHPSYDRPACGPRDECPTGLACGAQHVCEPPAELLVDAGISGPGGESPPDVDAAVCFGTGLVHVCLAAAPTLPLTISTKQSLDTDSSPMCVAAADTNKYCVITGTTISLDARLRAAGSRPLVLIASDSISVSGLIDVGSSGANDPEIGAGADPVSCPATNARPGVAGGGAGGSFVAEGGAGGASSGAGGLPGAATPVISDLRGGCPGQSGQGSGGGRGGHGGGAVYLIAGQRITVIGEINASGESGNGGTGPMSGGGGAGAGGMIGFDAPTIMGDALILANGGGGGEGSDDDADGIRGTDPNSIDAAAGGNGGADRGGDGGDGANAVTLARDGQAGAVAAGRAGGGGGGGGAAGVVKAPAGAMLGTQVSPTPVR
jgi:hypothetical protein